MKRYITRHGQVVTSRYEGGPSYPAGDPPLSELGREQAAMLGNRLKEMGFCGKIISSPYMRTLETSQIIAEITDTVIIPCAAIREFVRTTKGIMNFKGLNIGEIKTEYSRVLPTAELAYPWWTLEEETGDDVLARVTPGIEALGYEDEELIFVGHGASSGALLRHFAIPRSRRGMLFNCSLSATGEPPLYCDTSHIPYEKTTNNYKYREEIDAEFFTEPYGGEIKLPEGFDPNQRNKILHIGDTYSKNYPYYKKLFEVVRPDIILHTGDMADEVKVGRIPGTEYEYLSKIKVLLEMMHSSTAKRILISPGNNDLPDEIKRLAPYAEVIPQNTEMTLGGRVCKIGHIVRKLDGDADFYLYGHGLTGETWKLEYNADARTRRFNVMWGSFVYNMEEMTDVMFPLPPA